MESNFSSFGLPERVKRKASPRPRFEIVAKGPQHSSIPAKFQTRVIPNSEKKGFNSQSKRFQETENENPGPGFYNVTHQSALLSNVSQSQKGTCFFPSLDMRIARQRVPSYPAANAYSLPSTLQSKQNFSLGCSSMFQLPIARKISKRSTPAPNQYNRDPMHVSSKESPIMGLPSRAVLILVDRKRRAGNIFSSQVAPRPFVSKTMKGVSVDFCKQNCGVGAKSVFSSRTSRALSFGAKDRGPSPCHYRINESLVRQSPTVPVSCFRSRTSREIKTETLSPGPAAYQHPDSPVVAPSRGFRGLRKYGLNFSSPPVPRPETPPSPGPGQYEIVDYRGPPKHYISSAVFVSNTNRWARDKFRQEIPGPGAYTLPTGQKQSFIYNSSNKWMPVL